MIRHLYELYLQHPEVSTDSRTCPEGAIFFALKGEHFDGNQYAAQVIHKGAAIAVVDDPAVVIAHAEPSSLNPQPSVFVERGLHGRFFLVDDVLSALQQLAAYHREQFRLWQHPVSVIGITGTNGKTTTKELLNAVLSRRYNVLATSGNLNNQIGVPLTLLRVAPQHELAIVEMGANHPLDIEQLCSFAHPDYGLITNVGRAHLQGFGSLEGVVTAKTKLYESLNESGGTIFVDGNNQTLLDRIGDTWSVTYGTPQSRVSGRVDTQSPLLSVVLTFDGQEWPVRTHLVGAYNLVNIIAAAAVGLHFGVASVDIVAAIEAYEPSNMRSQLVDLGYGRSLILDAYNANPTSMMAALDSLNHNAASHKSAVLGAMGELGTESQAEHRRILDYLSRDGVTIGDVLLVGSEFIKAFSSLSDDEVMRLATRRSVRCYDDVDALATDVEVLHRLPGTILVKGSRSQHLERLRDLFA